MLAEILELMRINIFSPMVLAFGLGIIAVLVKSELRIPDAVYGTISIYLLLSIGLEGGFDLAETPIRDFIGPALVVVVIGALIPVWTYFSLTRFGGLNREDALAVGIHFGGVSSVTLSAAIAFLSDVGVDFEGYLPTLYVVMELPAFFVALLLVASQLKVDAEKTQSIGEIA